ncbi:MAG: carbohydrate ABC transporter permease [Bacilli bacterium]
MKKALKAFVTWFSKRWETLQAFYQRRIDPIFTKVGYALTHNVLLREDGNLVILFSFLKIRITRKRRHAFYGYLFIFPWLIGMIIFTLYPLSYSFYLSFHEAYYNLEEGVVTTFIGFTNYLNIFRSQILLPLYTNYVGRMLVAVPIILVFSIIIAVLVNMPIRSKGLWRTIFFLPVIIATGPVINELNAQSAITLPNLQASGIYGYIVNNLPPLLADPLTTVINSMLLILWYAGIPILIFLAGLQKIDPSLYEAASMDGASPWMRFWKITLPSLIPFMGISIVYVVVSMSLFVEPGGILDLTRTHMLVGAPDSAFWFGYGYAAAMAWVYFILMVILIAIFTAITRERRMK